MATFTMTLKKYIDYETPNIGLETYPIFDETYRAGLNQKIINHYWNQEIGQESTSLFKFALMRKMNEIMPLYNDHYKISQIQIDALSTADFTNENTNTGTTVASSHGSNDSTADASSRAVSSDTPQTALQADADYATAMQDNISKTTANGTADNTENSSIDGTGTAHMHGYQGHQPQLLLAARQTLINVDMMIINELSELFMSIWSNGDEYTDPEYGVFNYYGY